MTSWSRRFQDPITMPDGSTIRTIGEAAEYAISRPKRVRDTEPWQRAAKVLHEAAEHGGPFVFMARIPSAYPSPAAFLLPRRRAGNRPRCAHVVGPGENNSAFKAGASNGDRNVP
jgi:hypothetical protein